MSLRWTLLAMIYDRQSAKAERSGLAEMRSGLLSRAAGRVLEIGAGTGANLAHYGPDVSSLTLSEPEAPMLKKLKRKASRQRREATIVRAPAEDLPFDEHSFDTVVSTLVLCGVDDQPRALREIMRVLKPGGLLLFLEHVRSEDPDVAHRQDRMNGFNRFMVGCECNRPTLRTIETAGLSVGQLEHTSLPKAPKFISPTIVGAAVTPATVQIAESRRWS